MRNPLIAALLLLLPAALQANPLAPTPEQATPAKRLTGDGVELPETASYREQKGVSQQFCLFAVLSGLKGRKVKG